MRKSLLRPDKGREVVRKELRFGQTRLEGYEEKATYGPMRPEEI